MASNKVSIPKYRLHRGSGQAFVQIKGKRHYLGVYDSPKSKEAYFRFIAESDRGMINGLLGAFFFARDNRRQASSPNPKRVVCPSELPPVSPW
jgi:hypothetical protein